MQKAKPKFRVRQEAKEKNKDKRSDLFLGLPCLTHVCEEGKESSLRYHRPSFCLSIFFVFYSFFFSFFPPKARERASTRRENEIDERVHKTGLFGLPWVLLVYVFRLLIYSFSPWARRKDVFVLQVLFLFKAKKSLWFWRKSLLHDRPAIGEVAVGRPISSSFYAVFFLVLVTSFYSVFFGVLLVTAFNVL